MDHIIGGDHIARNRKASVAQPCLGERTRGRGYDGIAVRRQAGHELERAGKLYHSFAIVNLHLFYFAVLGFGVELGSKSANSFNAAPAMGLLNGPLRVQATFPCPDGPYSGDCRGGVHQDAVEIEKYCLTFKDHFPA